VIVGRTRHVIGLLHPAWGPLVRVAVRGDDGQATSGLAVLDTGASMSAIDRGIARELGLPTPGAATWFAVTAGEEQPVAPLRRAQLKVGDDRRWWELELIEVPRLDDTVQGFRAVALLGWDFLRLCRLTVDGPAGTFVLELPAVRGSGRRRR
jgi:hypothetical protein